MNLLARYSRFLIAVEIKYPIIDQVTYSYGHFISETKCPGHPAPNTIKTTPHFLNKSGYVVPYFLLLELIVFISLKKTIKKGSLLYISLICFVDNKYF